MRVVWHDHKTTQDVSDQVEVEKRLLNQFAGSWISKWTLAMSGIEMCMHLAGEGAMEFDTVTFRERFKTLMPMWGRDVDASGFKPQQSLCLVFGKNVGGKRIGGPEREKVADVWLLPVG
ncbi:hypothetical protein DES53_102130 [Roseimicrobium gellanilyticum]|uniref:Uncharacterized protein n=1 Tax=Roseimicrobium gellanilyticum TaxID=748857 RepID=A0A366HRP3_9BACT|nr:hypothetical protein DES53_102130 [Roseimicrobium gellanilyticum]